MIMESFSPWQIHDLLMKILGHFQIAEKNKSRKDPENFNMIFWIFLKLRFMSFCFSSTKRCLTSNKPSFP